MTSTKSIGLTTILLLASCEYKPIETGIIIGKQHKIEYNDHDQNKLYLVGPMLIPKTILNPSPTPSMQDKYSITFRDILCNDIQRTFETNQEGYNRAKLGEHLNINDYVILTPKVPTTTPKP